MLKTALLFLLLPHLALLSFHAALLVTNQAGPSLETILYGGMVLICLFSFIHGVWKDRKKGPSAVTHRFIILPLVLAGTLVWLGQDGPLPENDYQDTDVVCASDSGYLLLKQLSDMDAQTILAPVPEGLDALKNDPVQFEATWKKMKPYRQIVDELSKTETICDLSPNAPIDGKIVYLNITHLKTLTRIYNQHFLSGVQFDARGPEDEFIRLFTLWTTAFKTARIFLHKIMFASFLESQIQTAFQAVSSGRCNGKTRR